MWTPRTDAQSTRHLIRHFEIPRSLRALVRARESSLIFLGAGTGALAGLVVAAMSRDPRAAPRHGCLQTLQCKRGGQMKSEHQPHATPQTSNLTVFRASRINDLPCLTIS
jgi:hypothetical protein